MHSFYKMSVRCFANTPLVYFCTFRFIETWRVFLQPQIQMKLFITKGMMGFKNFLNEHSGIFRIKNFNFNNLT